MHVIIRKTRRHHDSYPGILTPPSIGGKNRPSSQDKNCVRHPLLRFPQEPATPTRLAFRPQQAPANFNPVRPTHASLPKLLQDPRLRIGADWTSSSSTFPVLNPATGECLAEVPLGNFDLLKQASEAARTAFTLSRQQPPHERARLLFQIAERLEEEGERFAHLICAEAGKPIRLARAEVQRATITFRIAAEEARRQHGSWLNLTATPAGDRHHGVSLRFPIGPIAALSPFNFPLNLVAHKLAPALACGCPLVLKPSPRTPLTALFLAQITEAAGLPPGFFNVVTCPNEAVPSLIQDPSLPMISFTGSASVGRALQALAPHKRWTLELGGNATAIVHADADIDSAASAIATGAYAYAGQTCISVQNVLVHREIYAAFRERLLRTIRQSIQCGNPLDPEVLVGPMIDSTAVQRTLQTLKNAIAHGARVLCGGTAQGAWFEPTLLENVPFDHPLWAEEAFAPVLNLAPYDLFEEALTLVNASRYGLQTGLFTRDFSRAWRAFQELEVGSVLINQAPTWRVENMPYGGVKESGQGREGVASAIESMTELRSWVWREPV